MSHNINKIKQHTRASNKIIGDALYSVHRNVKVKTCARPNHQATDESSYAYIANYIKLTQN